MAQPNTQSALYRAPFAPGGARRGRRGPRRASSSAIALGRGGDYADLFFEYRAAGGFVFDEGILKSASRGVSMGLGVRVQKGDATGYAYVERLDWDAMKRAAETAAQIASGGGSTAPVQAQARRAPEPLRARDASRSTCPASTSARCSSARRRPRTRTTRAIVKAEASLAEEIREILVVTSDGMLVRDTQPLVRFGVRAIAEQDGKRQEGSSGGGGRTSMGYFEGKSPEWHAREAARQAITMLDARRRPPGRWRSCSRRATAASCCTRRSGHGLEADFNRKGTSNYSGQIGETVASDLCTVVDDATLLQSRGTINVDDEGNEPRRSVAHREGQARRLHARPPERASTSSSSRAATAGARASPARRCRA